MILILIAILATLVASFWAVRYGDRGYRTRHYAVLCAGVTGYSLTIVLLAVYIAAAPHWFAAKYKADIINNEFDTSYTQADIFWADSVINEIYQLKRRRIELNGDLLRNGP